MNGPDILQSDRATLTDNISGQQNADAESNLFDISPWLAISLMQKAIRRGQIDMTLRAAATLLDNSPDRLWRRAGVTAYEDIGAADCQAGLNCLVGIDRVLLGKIPGVSHTTIA